jgi:CRISPR/Cas system CSM-associated protein Csm3 (group 7 of RAMP superfamily)
MSKMAQLQWRWRPAGPFATGYSQNLAQAAGLIERGARQVINLQTRDAGHELGPSFLASSVKGVFRTAAAWLVERAARQQDADGFVTCDYGEAVPERRKAGLVLQKREGLCPVCRVFGGSGCLSGREGTPAQRQQGRVRFSFARADDAAHGRVEKSPPYRFAWEQVEQRGERLIVQQLQFDPDAVLEVRIEPADEFALALLWLAGDLVSSGFFRFGRFTTRGYGVVRLQPTAYLWQSLDALLSGEEPVPQSVDGEQSGKEIAGTIMDREPLEIVKATVKEWLPTAEDKS